MKALLCRAGYESQVLAMARKGGWDTLLSAQTYHAGVALLAREMRKSPRELRLVLFQRLTALLKRGEACWEMPAMAFLVEARRMQCLWPLLVGHLQDADRDISAKALLVLSNVVHVMEKQVVAHLAPLLADKLLPLFDEELDCVRELSIRLFQEVMEAVVGTKTQALKKQVHRSLLPLLFHWHDEIPRVAQASQEALLGAAKLLRWEQLRQLAETAQSCRIGECLRFKAWRRTSARPSVPWPRKPSCC
ncbi:maestro heat-like repeat family member 5 [Struthio camelus]|uniref:maestro heat-like repeat family member 5 n=1 Tax=Struthio camelus TaxID=8801 RepID=UPI003603C320